MCYLGPSQSICCTGTSCNYNLQGQSYLKQFCSDQAQSYSMKYTFCPYNASSCMASDALLPASLMTAQQFLFTPAAQFNLNQYCYWIITPPSEFTADIVLKIRIDALYASQCYLNYGGSIVTASSEQACLKGQSYSFTYQDLGQVSNVYLVALATTNFAQIKFTYWAEARMSFMYLLLIICGSIVGLSLLMFLVFLFIIDCSIKVSLEETAKAVQTTFTDTIEEIEPGKTSSFNNESSNLIPA